MNCSSLEVITINEKVTPPFFQIYVSYFRLESVLPFSSLLLHLSFWHGILGHGRNEKEARCNEHTFDWGRGDVVSASESAILSPGPVS